jgi:Ca-activated chloride channel family protein
VFEDAQEVAVEGFGTTEDLPLSIALAVDTSGSMIESYGSVLRAIDAFAVNLMRPGDEATALTFAWEAIVQVRWTDDAEAVMPQLERIQPEGGTSLHDAVVKSLEQFRGRRGQQALILLTDGEDTTSRTGWDLALRFAHTMRIPIFPIGLGMSRFDYSQRKTLRRLAEETGGEAFFPKDTGELSAAYGRIGDLLRSQYLLWYSSNSAKPAEAFRAIEVRVPGRPEATVRTIRGYYPGK